MDEFRDQPDNVAVIEIVVGIAARASYRLEERPINRNGNLRSPAAQSRHLDLQLRHEALRARRSPIRPPHRIRKRRYWMGVITQIQELGLHASTREIYRLDFQPVPSEIVPGRSGNNKVDFSRWLVRARSVHERHFAGQHRFFGSKADNFREPIHKQLLFLEPDRTNDDRLALGWTEPSIFAFLVTMEGTHAATFSARGFAPLERAWRSFAIFLQGFHRQSATLIGRNIWKRPSVPFRDPVSRAQSTNTGRGVMRSSGIRAWWVFFMSTRTA